MMSATINNHTARKRDADAVTDDVDAGNDNASMKRYRLEQKNGEDALLDDSNYNDPQLSLTAAAAYDGTSKDHSSNQEEENHAHQTDGSRTRVMDLLNGGSQQQQQHDGGSTQTALAKQFIVRSCKARQVSSSSSPRSLLHSSNNSSSTNNNNNHDSINNTNTANIGVAILAELKKIEQRQTQRQATMHQELKEEFKKMQDVLTAKISLLEQTVKALRQQQPNNQQHQQTVQIQEGITGIDVNGISNKKNNNNDSEDGYDDEKKDDNGDGDCDGHDNNNDIHADVKDGNEIQNNDKIIVISSSSSNSREDDDDDDRIENNGDADTTAAAALLNSSIFDDEDTNNKQFKAWKRRYDVLQKYVESNCGRFPVNRYKDTKKDGFALGYWVQAQKTAYLNIKKGKTKGWRMTKPRIEYLEQISNWTWGNKLFGEREFADDEDTRNNNRGLLMEEDTNSQYFKKWNRQYEVLQEYVKSNNGRIPIGLYTNGIDGFQLGYWVKNQKAGYWNKIKGRAQSIGNSMTKPRAEWLESIPNWTWGACCVDGTRAQLKNTNNDSGMIDDDDEDELADDVIIF